MRMSEKVLEIKRFHGGISEDLKDGVPNSFYFGRSLDYRSEPSLVSILPRTAKESGSTVTDLIKWFEAVGTTMYSYGSTGRFYSRTSTPTWSLIGTLTSSSGNGMAYFALDDFIYLSKDSAIARYGPLGGTPALTQDYFSDGTVDRDQFLDSSGATYSVPTSITENATNRQDFTPQKDPQKAIIINVSAKGTTADWTVAVHDEANNQIATATLTNANVVVGNNTFTFSTPWRPVIGAEYHFHVTVTDTAGTPALITGTNADLNTADFETLYQILVTETNFHPCKEFNALMCFGNERYLATYNGIPREAGATVYNPHALTLPAGWHIRDLEKVGEYLAVLAVKSNTVVDFDESLVAFWDGTSVDPTFFEHIKDSTVTAMGVNGKTLELITSTGIIYEWTNGQLQKVKTLPKMTNQTYIDVFPGAYSSWRGLSMIGVAGNSDNTNVEKGVYSYGTVKEGAYPKSLNYDFPLSTGNRTGNNVRVGAVGRRGDALFIGWRDDGASPTTFGCDVVTNNASPFTSAVLELLVFDNNQPWKQKLAKGIKVRHTALKAGESVQIGYKIDRTASYTTGAANTAANSTETKLPIPMSSGRFNEIQVEVLLTATTTAPSIISVSLLFDDLSEETIYYA